MIRQSCSKFFEPKFFALSGAYPMNSGSSMWHLDWFVTDFNSSKPVIIIFYYHAGHALHTSICLYIKFLTCFVSISLCYIELNNKNTCGNNFIIKLKTIKKREPFKFYCLLGHIASLTLESLDTENFPAGPLCFHKCSWKYHFPIGGYFLL